MSSSPFDFSNQHESVEHKIIVVLERISEAFRVLLWNESKEYSLSPIQVQVLIKKGIISTEHKEGKRAFRVYPIWDIAKSKQAERTQKWQLSYFYEINNSTDLNKVAELYETD